MKSFCGSIRGARKGGLKGPWSDLTEPKAIQNAPQCARAGGDAATIRGGENWLTASRSLPCSIGLIEPAVKTPIPAPYRGRGTRGFHAGRSLSGRNAGGERCTMALASCWMRCWKSSHPRKSAFAYGRLRSASRLAIAPMPDADCQGRRTLRGASMERGAGCASLEPI